MQINKFLSEVSFKDRSTARTTAISGAVLVLMGVALFAAAIARAGDSSGAATLESMGVGIVAAAFGAFLARFGFRAMRKLNTAPQTAETAETEEVEKLDKAA